MADVELVIKIPKEDYEAIKDNSIVGDMTIPYVFEGIRNGTPLPKGHGRLIDANAYRKEMLNSREFDFFKRLDMQPTIIETDKIYEKECMKKVEGGE